MTTLDESLETLTSRGNTDPPVAPAREESHICEICARGFTTPQGLGRHKATVHGIEGTSSRTRQRRKPGLGVPTPDGKPRKKEQPPVEAPGPDQRTLLTALFPDGAIPISKLDRVQAWLAEASQLATTGSR